MPADLLGRRLVHAVRLARWERRVEAAILRAQRKVELLTLATLVGYLTAAGPVPTRVGARGRPPTVPPPHPWNDDEWDRLLQAELRPVAGGIMGEVQAGMLAALPDDLDLYPEFDFEAQTERLVAKARGIGPAIAQRITDALQEGAGKGEGIDDLRDRVRGAFRATEYRARMIARTEVVSATNGAAHSGAGAIVSAGMPLDKVWLAAIDNRTRASHLDADGQRVAHDQDFVVGGALMAYPGDPAGPSDEVVNCRCSIYFEPPEEA